MFNLKQLQWQSDSFSPAPDKTVNFQYVDISEHLPVCAEFEVQARLCKYSRTYSINLAEDDVVVSAIKQIDIKMFEDDPQYYLKEADTQFRGRLNWYEPDEWDVDF